MNFLSYLVYIDAYSFVIYFYLFIFILYKGYKSALNRSIAALLICFCLWSFCSMFTRNPATAKSSVRLFYGIASLGWISFSSFFLRFALVFSKKQDLLKSKLFNFLLFLPPAIFIYQQWQNNLIADYLRRPYGWSFVWARSIWSPLFYLYYVLVMAAGLILLLNFWWKADDPINKQQAKIIFYCTFVTILLGSLTNVLFQEINIYTIPPVANNLVLIWAVGIVYAIIKYKFLIITPDTTAQVIISSITESLILLDRDGMVVTINKTAEETIGYQKDELEGKPFAILLPDGSPKELLEKITTGQIIRNYELSLKRKNTQNLVVDFTSSPLKDNRGYTVGIVCVATDTTARTKAKEALQESESRYRLLAENETDFIIKLDPSYRFIFVSPSFCKLFAKKEDEFLGKEFTNFIYEKEPRYILEAMERLTRPPYNVYVEHLIMSRYGERWLAWTFRSLLDEKSKVTEVLGVGHDITERKKSNEALRDSEQKFKNLVENNSDFIWEFDKNLNYTYASPNIKDILGYDARVVIGETPFYFLSEEEEERIGAFLKDKMAKKEPFYGLESINLHREGYLVALETNGVPIFDEKGELKTYRGVSRNITERKKLHDQLLHAAEEWRTVFDSIADMIMVLDRDFRITRLNMAFAKAFRMHPKDVVGKFCYNVIFSADKPCLGCPHKYTLERGLPKKTELDLTDTPLGIYANVSTSPILNRKGDVVASVCIIKDWTPERELQKEQELTQLGRLVTDMAGELNDPLMIIQGRAKMALTEDLKNEKVKDDIKTIIEESQSVSEVIRRLIHFARPSKLEFKPLDINKSIEAVISVIEPQLKLAHIEVNRTYAKDLPPVLGDEEHLQEAVMNLLSNSREAMSGGGAINITTVQEGSFVKMTCQDSGVGMPKEVLRRLFEPFFTTKEKGMGLGLSVSYGIIKAHKGELKLESKVEGGTTATILLPLK